MITLNVTHADGREALVRSQTGISLMEALRDNGIHDIMALCGGCCSCATCHVFIQSEETALTRLSSDDENDLLDSSEHRRPNSRLSCQITLTDAMDGCRVHVAPED